MLRIQERLRPYKDPENNRIEMLAMIAGISTLYWALVFVYEGESLSTIYNLSLVFLFIVNWYFLLEFFFLLLCSLKIKNKYFKTFVKIYATMLRKKVDNKYQLDELNER